MVELTLTGITGIGTHSSILPLIMIIGGKTNSLRRHFLVEIERGLDPGTLNEAFNNFLCEDR